MPANDEIKARFTISGPNLDRDEIVVGRGGLRVGRTSADNSLVLNHREISRQHMRIVWREDDKYLVEDLNSSNGVWLNETRITARIPQELNEGDVIRVGPYLLTFTGLVYPQPALSLPQPAAPTTNGKYHPIEPVDVGYLAGIPRDKSTWLQYLPAIYSDDEFLGRYLLIFESILSPIIWLIDNFDMYLSPDTMPQEWMAWVASWFDLLLVADLPLERQRELIRQAGWLFLRRGTRAGLQRLLELYFGVTPEIIEDETCHFLVRLPLSQSSVKLGPDVANRLIQSQKPAFAAYTLEVT
jgi:phage tail-like protein